MPTSKSPRYKTTQSYRDYVISDGRFIGRFDDMYRDIADPWGCTSAVGSVDNKLLLGMIKEHFNGSTVLDVGCGLGALTEHIYHTVYPSTLYACDTSATAIASARKKASEVKFFVHDLVASPRIPLDQKTVDCIVMSEVIWYILPVLGKVLRGFVDTLSPKGMVFIKQALFPPGVQAYGTDIATTPNDLKEHVIEAGLLLKREQTLILPNGAPTWYCAATLGTAPS